MTDRIDSHGEGAPAAAAKENRPRTSDSRTAAPEEASIASAATAAMEEAADPRHYITIRGAREHNLKNVSLVLPKNRLIVFTGLSGSGKSSLAFDTIYAEGQRRYVESLSAYARQFL